MIVATFKISQCEHKVSFPKTMESHNFGFMHTGTAKSHTATIIDL